MNKTELPPHLQHLAEPPKDGLCEVFFIRPAQPYGTGSVMVLSGGKLVPAKDVSVRAGPGAMLTLEITQEVPVDHVQTLSFEESKMLEKVRELTES